MHILLGLSSVLSDPGSSDQRVDSGVNLLPGTLSDMEHHKIYVMGKLLQYFMLSIYFDFNMIKI